MPPYNPPVGANYAHVKVPTTISQDQLLGIMGIRGSWFKEFTQKCNLKYVWYNAKNKYIELWGRHDMIEAATPILVERIKTALGDNDEIETK